MPFYHQLYILIGLNSISAILILTALMTHKLDDFSAKYRTSIMLVGIGCIGQIAVLLQTISYGTAQQEYTSMLYWIVKDTGLTIWFTLAFYDIQIKNLCLKFSAKKDKKQHV